MGDEEAQEIIENGGNHVSVVRGPIHLKPPNQLDFHSPNLQHRWKKWREETELYLDLSTEGKSAESKIKYFRYLIGPQGREVYETFTLVEGERTLQHVFDAFELYCNPKKSETVERYKFFTRNQDTSESYDVYITDLKILATTCNFGTLSESLIRDRIVCGVTDKQLRERLLREDGLDLEKCVRLCRASEISKEQLKTLDTAQTVHTVREKNWSNKPKNWNTGHHSQKKNYRLHGQRATQVKPIVSSNTIQCRFCGREHERNRSVCPAFGKTCSRCKQKNHSPAMCRTMQSPHHSRPHVNIIHEDEDSDEYFSINSLTLTEPVIDVHQVQEESECPRQIFASMNIAGKPVSFQVDTGATCNLIPSSLLPPTTELQQTSQLLRMYDKTVVKPLGKCPVKVVNPKDGRKYKVDFIVLSDPCATPILGSHASMSMKLIRVDHEHITMVDKVMTASMHSINIPQNLTLKGVKEEFKDVFTGTGEFEGAYKIRLDISVASVVHPPRKVPLALKPKLKAELERLVNLKILVLHPRV